MSIPKYDIFAGRPGSGDVLWKEVVEGLGAAHDRMKELATASPGPYFVFEVCTSRILARVDTSPGRRNEKREAS